MQDSSFEKQKRGSTHVVFRAIGAVFTGLRLLIGLALLVVALAPPLMNRQIPDRSKIARKSKAITAEDTAVDGEFVSITGVLVSDEAVGDQLFNISGPYLFLRRRVEMYSWIETDSFSYNVKFSSSSVQEKRREDVTDLAKLNIKKTYRLGWSEERPALYSAGRPERYVNPRASIRSERFTARGLNLGEYRVDPGAMRFPGATPLSIDPEKFSPAHGARLEDSYVIFVGEGTSIESKVGDLRIQYDALESGATVTLFGKLNGDAIEPYIHSDALRFHQAFAGSREDALDKMQAERRVDTWIEWGLRTAPITRLPQGVDEYSDPASEIRRALVEEMAENREFVTAATWILRGAGLFTLWIGLCMFVGPIKRVVDSAIMVDEKRHSRLVLPMLLLALILSALLWTL